MHPDASNAQGRLLLPKQTHGDHALKPRGFWNQTPCNPEAKLKLPTQSSSSYYRQHAGERVDCRTAEPAPRGAFSRQLVETAEDMTSSMSLVLLPYATQPSPLVWEWIFLLRHCTPTLLRFGSSFVVYPNPE